MPNFNSQEDVKSWLDANGGVEGMRQAVETGRFANQNKVDAQAWLNAHDRGQREKAEIEQRALIEREIKAAESSAASAETSAKYSKYAAVIAVIAAIVSVAQYLNQR
jgi:hypothetical protein